MLNAQNLFVQPKDPSNPKLNLNFSSDKSTHNYYNNIQSPPSIMFNKYNHSNSKDRQMVVPSQTNGSNQTYIDVGIMKEQKSSA